jgi:pimeloyl-ACP methyl ester carboxylesterase
VAEVDLTFADLRGSLNLPPGPGPHPAIVGLHPANDGSRDHFLFRHLAQTLAPLGIAVLRFDRRGHNIPLEIQAADALAAVRALRGRTEIDPRRVGLWGFSQGAWVAPLAAARSRDVAFLVLVASTGVSPAQQMRYGTAFHLRRAGYGDAAVDRLLELRRAVEAYHRGGRTRDDAQRKIDESASEPWFPLAHVPRVLGARPAWPDIDFDPEAVFARVKVPVLLFYGEVDEWQPIDASIAAWRRAARSARNEDVTVVQLQGTGHHPTLREGGELSSITPAYTERLTAWLRSLLERPASDSPDRFEAGSGQPRERDD